MKRAFTLVEVVVVMAIVMILAAILFPVFRSAKVGAQQSACIANFRQAHLATTSYLTDYSDAYPIAGYQLPGEGDVQNDKTWVQLVLPYARDFRIFRCPGDKSRIEPDNGTFDGDLVVGNAYGRYYEASKRVNIGYNYLYLSPIMLSGSDSMVVAAQSSMVGRPSRTFLFVDSVHDLNQVGVPTGGGSYLVMPPCRYSTSLGDGGPADTFWGSLSGDMSYYQVNQGWTEENGAEAEFLGGAWAWHNERVTVINVDGSADAIAVNDLQRGCDVKPNWSGTIFDTIRYPWDLN